MSLTRGLARTVRIRGSELAVVDGAVRLDWRTLADRVARMATVLQAQGVRRGDRVALLAHNSHRHLEAQYATLWLGAVVVPLNNRLSPVELDELAADAEPALLLFDGAHADAAERLLSARRVPNGLVLGTDGSRQRPASEALLAAASPCADQDAGDDEVALLYYTGGTTGRPKGVMLTHANVEANSINFIAGSGMDERTVHLHCGPLFHVGAGARIYSTTRAGGVHVMLPRFEVDAVLEAIDAHAVTLATFVPTMAKRLVERLEREPRGLPSLRLVTYGGAPMPTDTLQRLQRLLPHVGLLQSYGQTECAPVATLLLPRDHGPEAAASGRLASAGRAALLSEVRIADAQDHDCATGTVGEVLVRGPMVMRGYWRQPEATREALRGGWLHTGDAGWLDEAGYLYVVDRYKDMVISGGENVYSIEVENALYAHPAVAQCAVFGVPHAEWGEAVHAVVVPHAGMAVDAAGLQAHCRGLLAAYKCPRSIELRNEPLPLSGANKILKAALKAAHQAQRKT